MSQPPTNVLFIMSDEHTRRILGCYGHPLVKTPNLDRLAARGTRFSNAYTPSPMCIPARSAIATGRYCHEIGAWESAHPYPGTPRSWMHHLRDEGHQVVSIGKLHYRGLPDDDHGHSEEIEPLHAHDNVGWLHGLLRQDPPPYDDTKEYAEQVGWGESPYTNYDRRLTKATCNWLTKNASLHQEKPWVLFASLVSPHYPLTAPEQFQHLYPEADMPLPKVGSPLEGYHPAVAAIRNTFNYADHFDEAQTRRARASYFALCTFLDEQIGLILAALDEAGLTETTTIIYTSDHGDMLGEHGFWAKSTMHEDSAGVPLIMAGAGIPAGHIVHTPVSLIDIAPTIIDRVGAAAKSDNSGQALFEFIEAEEPDRTVLCEYHDGGSLSATFLLRWREWKYIYHVGFTPQLFNLDNDPLETVDLGDNPIFANIVSLCDSKLRLILDPEQVNEQAFAAQERRIAEVGGRAMILKDASFGFTPIPD